MKCSFNKLTSSAERASCKSYLFAKISNGMPARSSSFSLTNGKNDCKKY